MRSFDDLVAEGEAVPTDGWDFSWFSGRATEERPPWGYQRRMAERLALAGSALDLETGGGEVLAEARTLPRRCAATESWPPNVAKAQALLGPRGVVVVATREREPLPFAEGAFELVTSRHPVSVDWPDLARVIAPGGTYLAQHVGPASVFELIEFFLGPQDRARLARRSEDAVDGARRAGLRVERIETAELATRFFDIGAVVHFLRKVVWLVPGFTVAAHRERLAELDAIIRRDGAFEATTTRFLIEARKP